MRVSNNITAVVNFIALLCSIPIIASGLWLASKPDNECVHIFRWPVVVLGFLGLVISLLGFMGAYLYKESLLALYLSSMALLICFLLTILIFSFVITRPDGSYWVPNRGYHDYRLDGFSEWLKDHVANDESWAKIRNCLARSYFCARLNSQYITAGDFFIAHISPLQSGCCKPPTVCGYEYVSPTTWVNPTNPTGDLDCMLWSNEPGQLCYNCISCKAGLLGNLRKEWRKANKILIIALVLLIFVYVIACSAFRNARSDGLHVRHK